MNPASLLIKNELDRAIFISHSAVNSFALQKLSESQHLAIFVFFEKVDQGEML